MNRFKRLLAVVITFAVIITGLYVNVDVARADASGSVSISSTSATVGNNVTVSVSVSSSIEMSALILNIKYDDSILTYQSGADAGGNGIIRKLDHEFNGTSKTYSFTFNVKAVGSSSVSVDASSSYGVSTDGETKVVFGSASGTVTGQAPKNYSSDNTLASLSISPGTLSPSFSASTLEYTATVGEDVSSVVVSAKANDSTARVWVNTDVSSSLSYGSNRVAVVVTAENGETRTYAVTVTREGEEPTEAPTEETKVDITQFPKAVVGGQTYYVVDKTAEVAFPDGYETVTYTYHGDDVVAGKNDTTGLVIMYLESEADDAANGLYIYDEASETFIPYRELSEPQITYCILDIPSEYSVSEGWSVEEYELNGNKVNVLMNEDKSYCMFYGVSSEGDKGWFLYRVKDGTVQYYDSGEITIEAVAAGNTDNTDMDHVYDALKSTNRKLVISIIILAILLVIAVAAIVAIAIRLRKTAGTGTGLRIFGDDEFFDEDDSEASVNGTSGLHNTSDEDVLSGTSDEESYEDVLKVDSDDEGDILDD